MMNTRPERIKIISKRVMVEYVAKGENGLDPECDGKWIPQEQLIVIEEGLKPDLQKVTILHETLHSISDEMGIGLTEEQVEGAAKGILAVLMDNPAFARYLLRKA